MHECDGANAAHTLGDGSLCFFRVQTATLQPQQRRDGLQVVLHPVVNLANGGVLRQQQLVALAHLGDIAHQQQAAGDGAVLPLPRSQHRHATHQQNHVGGLLELLDHGQLRFVRQAHRAVVEAQLGQSHADCVGANADPVQRRHCVGRRVADTRFLIERHHTVTHAWGRAAVSHRTLEGKRPFGDHRCKPLEQTDVCALQLAGLTARPAGPFTRQHSDRMVACAHRHSHHPHRIGHALHDQFALNDLTLVVGLCQQRQLLAGGGGADIVVVVDRLAGGRAHMGDHVPLPVRAGHIEQQVSEAEVGQ